jgi:hypothetical protein
VVSELPEAAHRCEGGAIASRTLLDLSLLSLVMGSDYLPRPSGLKLASTYPAYAITLDIDKSSYRISSTSTGESC